MKASEKAVVDEGLKGADAGALMHGRGRDPNCLAEDWVAVRLCSFLGMLPGCSSQS